MRRLLRATAIVALVSGVAHDACAQHWAQVFDNPSVYTVRATADGGFVAGGQVGGEAWLLRAGVDAIPVWQRRHAAAGPWAVGRLAEAPDGGFFAMAGGVAKVDADGDIAWVRVLRSPALSYADVTALSDGGALLAGGAPPCFWKLDASGATVRFDELALRPTASFRSVAPTRDGGAILAATWDHYDADAWLVRLDASGAVVAQATVDVGEDLQDVVVTVTADGGFVLALWFNDGMDFGGVDMVRVVKLDASLALEWATQLDVALMAHVSGVCELADGAIALACHVEPISPMSAPSLLIRAASVVVLEPTGELRWARGFLPESEESEISPLPDGGALLWYYPILRRLDASGVAGDGCPGESVDVPVGETSVGSWMRVTPTAIVAVPVVPDVVPWATVPADTSVALSPVGDSHEPDDSCSPPRPFPEGTTQRNFCDDGEDWQDLLACAGASYEISTSSLGALADTVVEVFSPDCATLLASDDDGGGGRASRLAWVAPEDGTYHVRIRQSDATAGFDRNYDLTLTLVGPGCATWRRDFRAPDDDFRVEPAALSSREDGSLLLAGRWEDPGWSGATALLAGLGSSGERLWHDGSAHSIGRWPHDEFTSVVALPGGGTLVAGQFGQRVVLRLRDPAGALLWERIFGSSTGQKLEIRRVIALAGGGFASIGGVSHPLGGRMLPWIVRLADDGTLVWSRVLEAPYAATASDGIQSLDGGLLIASPTTLGGLLLSKVEWDGSVTWQRLHLLTADGWLAAAARTLDRGIVVTAGDTILRLDEAGDLEWSLLVGDGAAWMKAAGVAPTEDGGVVVAGSRFLGPTDEEPFLARIDRSGDVEWQRVAMGADVAGRRFVAVAATPERAFVAATATSDGMALFKVDGLGMVSGACALQAGDLAVSPGRRDVVAAVAAAAEQSVDLEASTTVSSDRGLLAPMTCAGGLSPSIAEDCFNGVDDDGDALVDCLDDSCGASDVDEDGAFDCIDCAPLDEGARETPGEVEDLRVVKVVPDGFMVHLTWSDSAMVAAGDGTVHDLTSGSIAALHASGWSSPATCVGNDVAQLDRHDMRPFVTECWWLVRAENACGTGSWGGSAVPLPDCP